MHLNRLRFEVFLRTWFFLLSFLTHTAIAAELISDADLEAFANQTPSFSQKGKEDKRAVLKDLRITLLSAASVQAKNTFFQEISTQWNSNFDEKKKTGILNSAVQKAQEAAKKTLQDILVSSSGRSRTVSSTIVAASGYFHPNDSFYELTRFLDNNLQINRKALVFQPNSPLVTELRPEVDLVRWADENFPGSVEERQEMERNRAKKFANLRTRRSDLPTNLPEGSENHSGNLGACGTPSSMAAALRPETNGMR